MEKIPNFLFIIAILFSIYGICLTPYWYLTNQEYDDMVVKNTLVIVITLIICGGIIKYLVKLLKRL